MPVEQTLNELVSNMPTLTLQDLSGQTILAAAIMQQNQTPPEKPKPGADDPSKTKT